VPRDPSRFSDATKKILAERANYTCSNPDCGRPTTEPHTDPSQSVRTGEAAHIHGAHEAADNRFDPKMTDDERSSIDNGVWLCADCADRVDTDRLRFPSELLAQWKSSRERTVRDYRHQHPAAKEVFATDDGIGSIINNSGSGIGEEVVQRGPGPGQRTTVQGRGVGEIIVNTGLGTGKKITSSGNTGVEVHTNVTKSVEQVAGLMARMIFTECKVCRRPFQATVAITGFAGDTLPLVHLQCPFCGAQQPPQQL
jgi:hypothetical protein